MSKKTETIEVRVSPELKSDLAQCSAKSGRSMSDMVRRLIEAELTGTSTPQTGVSLMFPNLFARLRNAGLYALPVMILASIHVLSAQSPVSAAAEFRVFFAELDADGDGRIVEDEVVNFLRADGWTPDPECGADEPCTLEAEAAEHFARADADGDGAVVYAELEALFLRDRAEEFLDADLDENGFVTVDELVGVELYWYAENPDEAAADDIILSQACIDQLLAEQVADIARTCGAAEEGRLMLAEFDADRDGQVSLVEYLEN